LELNYESYGLVVSPRRASWLIRRCQSHRNLRTNFRIHGWIKRIWEKRFWNLDVRIHFNKKRSPKKTWQHKSTNRLIDYWNRHFK